MIKIAIVEDNAADRERIKTYLKEIGEKEKEEFSVDEFENADSFFMSYQPVWHIIFMDIEMPGTDGMEAARRLRQTDSSVALVFVTNLAQYALKGYEVDALDYILKPVDGYSFALKMKRILARSVKNRDDSLLITTDSLDTVALCVSSIRYIEVRGHYVTYHTAEGEYSQYSTLKDVEKRLNDGRFVKCNRCFLVNLSYVDKVSDDYAVVGRDRLPISRPQKKAFLNALSDYLGGRKNV